MAGLTSQGFSIKRVGDVVADMERGLREAFGAEIVTGAGTGFGKLIGVVAREAGELWELAQDTYDSQYPDTAEGSSLDQAGAYTGHRRLAPRASRAWCRCDAVPLTVLPSDSRASHGQTRRQFRTTAAATIRREEALRARWRVSGGPHGAGTTVTATLGSGVYLLTMGGGGAFDPAAAASDATVATSLANAINGGFLITAVSQVLRQFTVAGDHRDYFPRGGLARVSSGGANDGTYNVTASAFTGGSTVVTVSQAIPAAAVAGRLRGGLVATVSGAEATADLEVPAGVTDVSTADLVADAASSVAGRLSLVLVGTPVLFDSVELERVEAASGALSRIDTPVVGWSAVTNPLPADVGNPLESDADFRLRRADSLRVAGSATVEAIRSRLRQVANVDRAFVFENDGDVADVEGRPPHSFEAVVTGGTDAAVAAMIFTHKPAGIRAFGTTVVTVTDSMGVGHAIGFTRPASRTMHVRVNVITTYAEEPLPTDAVALIRSAVVTAGNLLQPGVDIIPQRFVGPVHAAVRGLENVTVDLAVDNGAGSPGGIDGTAPAGTYVTVRVPMSSAQFGSFDVSRVVVTGL